MADEGLERTTLIKTRTPLSGEGDDKTRALRIRDMLEMVAEWRPVRSSDPISRWPLQTQASHQQQFSYARQANP